MADEKMINRAEQVLYKTYNRFPVVFDHGKGVTLWDSEGQEYLDFGAGIAVMGLGYADEEYTQAVKAQLDKLTHISNLFYNEPSITAGEKLLKVSGMDKVFFTNSGTEAVEGALKIAKRYHYNKLHETMGDGFDGCEEKEIDMTGEIIKGLCHGHHIWLYAVMLPGEHLSGASHSALDLIQDQQDIVLIAQRPDAL